MSKTSKEVEKNSLENVCEENADRISLMINNIYIFIFAEFVFKCMMQIPFNTAILLQKPVK